MHQLDNATVMKINTGICAQGLDENGTDGTNDKREWKNKQGHIG